MIENLENLGEATSLIVTRDNGGHFKIGIQQSQQNFKGINFSDAVSSHAGSTRDPMHSMNKLSLRGKLKGAVESS